MKRLSGLGKSERNRSEPMGERLARAFPLYADAVTIRFHWDPPEGPGDRDDWEHTIYGALCWRLSQEQESRSLLVPPSSCDVHLVEIRGLWSVRVENVAPPGEKHAAQRLPDFSSEITRILRHKGKPVLDASARKDGSHSRSRKLASYRVEGYAWEKFCSELSRVKTLQDAVDLIYSGRARDARTIRYYTNLSVLVHSFALPEDSPIEEKQLYLHLVRRWMVHSPNMFAPGVLEQLEQGLITDLRALSMEPMMEHAG